MDEKLAVFLILHCAVSNVPFHVGKILHTTSEKALKGYKL